MENNQNPNQAQTGAQATQASKNEIFSALTIWQWISIGVVILGIILSFTPLYLLSDLLWVFGGMGFFLVSFLLKK